MDTLCYWNSIKLPEYYCVTLLGFCHFQNVITLPEFHSHYITTISLCHLIAFRYITGILLQCKISIKLHYQNSTTLQSFVTLTEIVLCYENWVSYWNIWYITRIPLHHGISSLHFLSPYVNKIPVTLIKFHLQNSITLPEFHVLPKLSYITRIQLRNITGILLYYWNSGILWNSITLHYRLSLTLHY